MLGVGDKYSAAFTSDAAGQLEIFWHDGHTFGMDGAQVGVFKETNQICFGGFLQGQDCGGLEAQVGFKLLGNFTDQTLERKFAEQEFRVFLIFTDFAQGNSTGAVAVGFFDTAGGRGGLAGTLGGQLFSGSLPPGGSSGGLFRAGHDRGRLGGKLEGEKKRLIFKRSSSNGWIGFRLDCRRRAWWISFRGVFAEVQACRFGCESARFHPTCCIARWCHARLVPGVALTMAVKHGLSLLLFFERGFGGCQCLFRGGPDAQSVLGRDFWRYKSTNK